MTIYISIFRAEDYRPEFSHLGEIRSLIPKHVNVMALTATATVMLQRYVMETLCMINPAIIQTSPKKGNLHFSVVTYDSVETSFYPLMEEVKKNRTKLDHTLIFCRRPIDCAKLWMLFCNCLGEAITEPPGSCIMIQNLKHLVILLLRVQIDPQRYLNSKKKIFGITKSSKYHMCTYYFRLLAHFLRVLMSVLYYIFKVELKHWHVVDKYPRD